MSTKFDGRNIAYLNSLFWGWFVASIGIDIAIVTIWIMKGMLG